MGSKYKQSIIGKRFGKLTIIGPGYIDKSNNRRFECKCDCGNTIYATGTSLIRGKISDCGCTTINEEIDKMVNKRFGRLIVVGPDISGPTHTPKHISKWICRCDCGNIKTVSTVNLQHGLITSCGCKRNEVMAKKSMVDLTGRRFGKLTVIKFHHLTTGKSPGHPYWLCKCDCGNNTVVSGGHLKSGKIVSCGCYHAEIQTTHGKSRHRLYGIYRNMICRCYNKNNKNYDSYGGRGIKVCDEWHGSDYVLSINNFITWAYANGYYDQPKDTPKNELLSIDRIDNDGPYAPWNCRWVNKFVQANNTRTNRFIYDGEENITLANFERKYDLPSGKVLSRISSGWAIDAIVYEAKHKDLKLHRKGNQYFNHDGFAILIPKTTNKYLA